MEAVEVVFYDCEGVAPSHLIHRSHPCASAEHCIYHLMPFVGSLISSVFTSYWVTSSDCGNVTCGLILTTMCFLVESLCWIHKNSTSPSDFKPLYGQCNIGDDSLGIAGTVGYQILCEAKSLVAI